MPVNPEAAIEITAFQWVPEFAQGVAYAANQPQPQPQPQPEGAAA